MKTIEERAEEWDDKPGYWTKGCLIAMMTELAADLNAEHERSVNALNDTLSLNLGQLMEAQNRLAEKEKEVAELRETNFALVKLCDAAPHAESCKFIPPVLRSELQDASGLCECDCWKSGSLDTALLDEVKRVLAMAENSALSWDMLGRAKGNIAVQIWREDALKLLTRLGGSHE